MNPVKGSDRDCVSFLVSVCPLPGPHCRRAAGARRPRVPAVLTASPADPRAVARVGQPAGGEGQVGADLDLETVGEQEGAGSRGTCIIHLLPPSWLRL